MAIAFRSSASVQVSGTVNKPAGTVAGDVLVAAIAATGGDVSGAPSGWTSQTSTNLGGSVFHRMYTKVAGGSEPSSYTWTASGTIIAIDVAAYSGCDATTPVNGTPTAANGGSSTLALGSITTTLANTQLVSSFGVYAFGGDGTGITQPPGQTEREEQNYVNTFFLNLSDEAIAASGATGTRTGTATGTLGSGCGMVGGMLALAPPSGTIVVGVPGVSTWAFPAPSPKNNVKLVPPAATSSWAMGTPTPKNNVKLVPTAMASSWAMPTPAAALGNRVTPAAMAGTWAMGTPSLKCEVHLSAPSMAFSLALPAPSAHLAYRLDAPSMSAGFALADPGLSLGIRVTADVMAADFAMGVPTAGVGFRLLAPPMDMSWGMLPPDVESNVTLDAPSMEFTFGIDAPLGGIRQPVSRFDGRAEQRWDGPRQASGRVTDAIPVRGTVARREAPRGEVA